MKILLLLLLLAPSLAHSQSLKKKYLGHYSGLIGSYRLGISGGAIPVEEAKIEVDITADSLIQTIDEIRTAGTYILRETKKDYTVIEFQPANQVILVEYRVYRKGKKIVRKGIYPQPDSELNLQR